MVAPPPVPEPPEAALRPASDDGVGLATVGTVVFAIGLGLCLLRGDELAARGDEWWTWTCASGVAVGLIFRAFASRRARAYREHAEAHGTAEPLGPTGG